MPADDQTDIAKDTTDAIAADKSGTSDDGAGADDTAADTAAAAQDKGQGAKGAETQGDKAAAKDGAKGAKEKPASLITAGADKKGAAGVDEAGKGKGKEAAAAAAWKPEAPEGVKFDEEALGEFKGLKEKLGLKNEDAQSIVNLGVKLQQKAAQAYLQAHDKLNEEKIQRAQKDPEIGGAKLEASLEGGLAALKRFSGDRYARIEAELVRTGLGNDPDFIALFTHIHEATKEDDTASRARAAGSSATQDPNAALRKMYPKMAEQLDQERGSG